MGAPVPHAPADLASASRSSTHVERRRRFALPLAAACAAGALISLGPDDGALSLPYDALRSLVPGLESARALNRFWVLPALGIALLAGRGFERLVGGAPRRHVAAGALVLVAVLLAELFVRPGTAAVADGPAELAVNKALGSRPEGVVTELPVPTLPDYPYVLAIRQLRSLEDGFPRVEGYSGDAPAGLPEYLQATSTFPSPSALQAMRQAGVRHVVLHGADRACVARYGPDELDAVLAAASSSSEVEDVTRVGGSAIVTLTEEPRRGPLSDIEPMAPFPRTTTSCERN